MRKPRNSHRYFENLGCKFHPRNNPDAPCHKVEHINCAMCFCPLFWVDCPRKDKKCADCSFPHIPENYDAVMKFLEAAYIKEGIRYDRKGMLIRDKELPRRHARKAYAQGMSVSQIARSMHLTERTIYHWVTETARKVKAGRHARCLRKSTAGIPVAQIATEEGVSQSTVYRWLKDKRNKTRRKQTCKHQ